MYTISRAKKGVNEQFGRKMNQSVSGQRKLFWKELGKMSEKEENCNMIKDRIGR